MTRHGCPKCECALQVEGLKKGVSLAAIRALAILGKNEEVGRAVGRPGPQGRGVRILSMDGGGMKVASVPYIILYCHSDVKTFYCRGSAVKCLLIGLIGGRK